MSTLLVMAGGTGGHVFPALAVARFLRERGVHIVWLGTRAGLEARLVPAAGFDMEWITIRGLRGKGLRQWLVTPFLVLLAMLQTVGVILRRRPAALLGMGGFVAGPGGLVAWLLRRPLVIHEQNAIAGLTNRWLARLADRVLTGFPETFAPARHAVCVGNPVRAEVAALPAPEVRLSARSGRLRLLVVGGSLGAQVFNEVVPQALAGLAPAQRPDVRHQCGRGRREWTEAAYRDAGVDATVTEFLDDMAAAYAWADLVLCRAGAMTIAELAAAGLPAILVPYPHAAGDHQRANATFLARHDAAILLPQPEFTPLRLRELLDELAARRAHLVQMAQRARALARPHATAAVAQACLEVLHA